MNEPKVAPAAKSTVDAYSPQGSGMENDAFFNGVVPGIEDSGPLAHKWDITGQHSNSEEPPSGLRGD